MKNINFLGLLFFCLVFSVGFAFYSNSSGEWIKKIKDSFIVEETSLFSEAESKLIPSREEVKSKLACWEPVSYNITALGPEKVSFSWVDDVNSTWEYVVQLKGSGLPIGSGFQTNKKEATVMKINSGANLLPDTDYEFYVRTYCGFGSTSFWEGPLQFKTPCLPMNVPLWDRFSDISKTANCWRTIKKGHKMSFTVPDFSTGAVFVGNRSVKLTNPVGDKVWLNSPIFKTDPKKVYRLKFHYNDMFAEIKKIDLLLSDKGIAPQEFNLYRSISLENGWNEVKLFLTNLTTQTTFAWLIEGAASNGVYIDNFYFEEVKGCQEPMFCKVVGVQAAGAQIEWIDDAGKEWEYMVREKSTATGIPVLNGTKTSLKQVNIQKDYKGNVLKSNTTYEFFIRTICGNGEYSIWLGPQEFSTTCGSYPLPFYEGFNQVSKSFNCWSVKNKGTYNDIFWRRYSGNFEFVGEDYMFVGINNYPHIGAGTESWLISPRLDFDKKKRYKLSFSYRTAGVKGSEFEILASNTGTDFVNFTKVLVAKKQYKIPKFNKIEFIISDMSPMSHIAWRVFGDQTDMLDIDDVRIEEVLNCDGPTDLNAVDIGFDRATISWNASDIVSEWEYIVQERDGGIPKGKTKNTAKNTNIIVKDKKGDALKSNTSYEFYVRSKCATGSVSEWSGPYYFSTNCNVFSVPFSEGFNVNSMTVNCWSVIDKNNVVFPLDIDNKAIKENWYWNISLPFFAFEGNGSVMVNQNLQINDGQWLVSPALTMDGGTYVLKYKYLKTNLTQEEDLGLEVFLSTTGVKREKFTTKLVSDKKIAKESSWQEEIVFIKGVSGAINLGWKFSGKLLNKEGSSVFLDDISLKKVETCTEPFNVVLKNQTNNSADIEWEQDGGTTDWEVVVLEEQIGITNSPTNIQLTTKPNLHLANLSAGRVYKVYVRAKCNDGVKVSDWSTPLEIMMDNAAASSCKMPIKIPVNSGVQCDKTITSSFSGTTATHNQFPICFINGLTERVHNEVWFEFTATSDRHAISVIPRTNLEQYTGSYNKIVYAIYDESCATMDFNTKEIECFETDFTQYFDNLVPGNVYLIRVGLVRLDRLAKENPKVSFNICITSYNGSNLQVKAVGDPYDTNSLVKEVLADTKCNLISNVTHVQSENGVVSLGYFNKNATDFPFEEGLVLSTNKVESIPGPNKNFVLQGINQYWRNDRYKKLLISPGNVDNDVDEEFSIYEKVRLDRTEKYISTLEFDFIPLSENFQLEYVYAHDNWSYYAFNNVNLAAIWLTEVATGEGFNIATITQDDLPMSLFSINLGRTYDYLNYVNNLDLAFNAEYFDKYLSENRLERFNDLYSINPLKAAINYVGMTVPIKTKPVKVKPGTKYRLKVAVADIYRMYQTSNYYDKGTSLFINGGSLNLDRLNLGDDLLIENLEALCSGDKTVIKSGLPIDNISIQWYRDGKKMVGETSPDITVGQAGIYKVIARYDTIDCDITGELKVEMYPLLSEVLGKPSKFAICRNTLKNTSIDLTSVERELFANVDKSRYAINYFETVEEAEKNKGFIENPKEYFTGSIQRDKVIYLRIEDETTGCVEVLESLIEVVGGEVPKKRDDVIVCLSYEFPELRGKNQYYYSGSAGKGESYQVGDKLEEIGEHTIYILQLNGEDGCYEEISYKVTITPKVVADVFVNETLECNYYQLKPLTAYNKYFTKTGGSGIQLNEGDAVMSSQTIYIFAQSVDGLCTDESSFTISFTDCPIPKGISPNGDGINDRLDLSSHGVSSVVIYNRWGAEVYSHGAGYTNQWHGQDKKDKALADGTYYYTIIAQGKTRTGWIQINK